MWKDCFRENMWGLNVGLRIELKKTNKGLNVGLRIKLKKTNKGLRGDK